MGLETGSFISALVSTNPVGATDPKSQGDDHLRFIKAKILETFANVTGAVTASHTELNLVAGATGGLATLSVSFAALATLVSQMGSFSASVTSSDITGSIRTPVLKTQAGFTAGTFTAATVVVNNKGIITGVSAASTSGTLTAGTTAEVTSIVASTNTTVAHGLGAVPAFLQAYLECTTTEAGYAVGDRVYQGTHDANATNVGWSVSTDATNTIILVASDGIYVLNRTTPGTRTTITLANWKIVAVPYKLN